MFGIVVGCMDSAPPLLSAYICAVCLGLCEWQWFLKNVSWTTLGVENDRVLHIPMSKQSSLHFLITSYSILFPHYVMR